MNKQLTKQITNLFDATKKDKNGNVTVLGRLSYNKQGGLSAKLYHQIAIGFFREYRRNLTLNGSAVGFDAIVGTLSEKVDFDQILAFRFVKSGEDKAGNPQYSKITYNADERSKRIREFSNRLKKHFAPAFGISPAKLSGVNFGVDDMQAIIRSAAKMVVRVTNPYVPSQKVTEVTKADGRKVSPAKNKASNRKLQPVVNA